MENAERQLIEKALVENFELRRLYNRHVDLDRRLKAIGRRPYLTISEEVEEKRLKHQKLQGVEKMLRIAAQDVAGQDVPGLVVARQGAIAGQDAA